MRLALISLFSLLAASPVWAFGLHYLVTDRALPTDEPSLNRKIKVEPLADFLRAEKNGVAELFAGFYRDLAARKAKRFSPQTFDTAKADVAAFLTAARLNPKTRILYLNRLLPSDPHQGPLVPFREVSYYEREEPGILFWFRDVTGQEVTAREILSTYSDEPDWGMDNDLWGIAAYGYGKQPYGKPEGYTTQAPFHCLYASENLVVRLAAKEVTEGMTRERVDLVSRLARLAFKSGHPYWGYRFTAWAIHYTEDLGQPYHTRAVPFADWRYYLKFLVSTKKAQMKAEATQTTINHHDLYEDYVRVLMQSSYTGNDPRAQAIVTAMADRGAEWTERDPLKLAEKIREWSSSHAASIDRTVMGAFNFPWALDPHYDVEADPTYQAREVPGRATGATATELATYVAENMKQVGRATRALWHALADGNQGL